MLIVGREAGSTRHDTEAQILRPAADEGTHDGLVPSMNNKYYVKTVKSWICPHRITGYRVMYEANGKHQCLFYFKIRRGDTWPDALRLAHQVCDNLTNLDKYAERMKK